MRIRKLVLETKEVASLTSFYHDVLELPALQLEDHSIITFGDSTIRFQQASAGQEPFYHYAINIPSNKVAEAKDWLEQRVELLWIKEYKSVIADFVNWNAKSLYFFDPAGNVVELIARFDLDKQSDVAFSFRQFLSISEIGLVFPEREIEARTESLLHNYSLEYFSKQPPSPNFKAVGDQEGLWIIVPEHRPWYPTHKAAGIFPLEVEFDVGKSSYRTSF